jgi:hypothetical protein
MHPQRLAKNELRSFPPFAPFFICQKKSFGGNRLAMNKKTILACFALLILGLLGSLIFNNFATQNKVSADSPEVRRSNLARKVLRDYTDISSLPANKRQEAFEQLPTENQVKFYKLNKAFQLVKSRNLNPKGKNLILKSISSTPSRADLEKALENQEDLELLERYIDLISIESVYDRKIAFRGSAVGDMGEFWKIHLAFQLANDETLSQAQSDIISNAIDFIKPEFFDESSQEVDREQLAEDIEEMTDQINIYFTEEKAVEIFARLGGPGECEPPAESNDLLRRDCSCRLTWRECSSSSACSSGGCDSTWFGCGFIWVQSCNGECRRAE